MTAIVCAALLLAGAAALLLIFNTEPGVEREGAVRETAMLVEVTRAEAGTFRPVIEAMGLVTPSHEVTLRPRVEGEVTNISESFVPGGFVSEGDLLLQIDRADYRNALAQARSELRQATSELEIEQGAREAAERDYRQLGRELEPDKRALVLREPQWRSAEARVQAARAAVDQARLNLERTTVTAPFDAQVLSRQANLGSQVSPGDPLARLAGTDTYWVEATVPMEKLRWLDFSGREAEGGSTVRLRHRNAWAPEQWREGRLYQLIGALEGGTRMARVLVEVDDPLGRQTSDAPALMIGAFVECRMLGRELHDTVRLRRDYLRKGDTVWLMEAGRLTIRPVDVVFRDAEYAYIRGGLAASEQVVTSSLATVKEGVKLRLKDAQASTAGANAGSHLATASPIP